MLIILSVLAYILMGIFSQLEATPVLTPNDAWLIVFGAFILSFLIAIISVIGGVVIFTPIMLGFTNVDTLIVRSSGLVVAMFSGLVSSGPFMRKGLADIRLVFYCSVPFIVGALLGAFAAIALADSMGEEGDAIVRLSLGAVLIFIAVMFITGGSKNEYPETGEVKGLDETLDLKSRYFEESKGEVVHYQATRLIIGGLLFLVVGFTGGFFGLGGGMAVVAGLITTLAMIGVISV